jgi:biotin synthase-related radical SAM superfamily protein
VQGEGEDAVAAYFAVTMRVPKGQSLAWINELATDHGEAALCAAIRATDADPPKTFLSRVQLSLTTVTVSEKPVVPTVKSEEEFFAAQAAKRQPARILDRLAVSLRGEAT